MNQKRPYRSDEPRPSYTKEVDVDVEARGRIKTYRLRHGVMVSVTSGINRPRGQYMFIYAEWNHTLGEHLLYVEAKGKRRCIRQADITKVIGGE